MNVDVLLSGRLRLDGYGKGKVENSDRTYRLSLARKGTVQDVVQGMGIPLSKVAMTMLNGRKCKVSAAVKSGDRVVIIPPDVAAFWRYLGKMNLGAESVFDF